MQSQIVPYLTFCLGVAFSSLIFSGLQVSRTNKYDPIVRHVNMTETQEPEENDIEAKRLEGTVRVLCWIMTGPQNLDTKAVHVKNTWGRRCTKLLFMSSVKNDTFPTVGLNVSEGREHLTAKTMMGFKYIYDHHLDDADWFMKADDDTYVILENLRYFLSGENSDNAVFFGHYLHPNFLKTKNGYFSGGAGYVLSKAALQKLAAFGKNNTLCRQDGGNEDLELGKCMENLNVTRGNTTDPSGKRRFHAFSPQAFLHGQLPKGFTQYERVLKAKQGMDTISDYAISFHYINPKSMYDMEFFVYHLRPYGLTSQPEDLKVPI